MDDKKNVSETNASQNFAAEPPKTPAETVTAAEAPDLAPPNPGPAPVKPQSQALRDIEEAGLTPDEANRAQAAIAADPAKGDRKSGAENLATVARFRWVILFVLSLASVAAWAVEAQISHRPFNLLAWGYLALTLILTIPTMKFLRIPTRGGLAALMWAGTFLISALYGPPETLFNHKVPAALPWAGLLSLIMLWMAVAVWRKVGRYKVIDIIMAVILVYAALSPLWALVDNLMAGNALFLRFQTLSASPAVITNHLPWFLWPMTVTLMVILPLCALLSFWDQLSVLKRRGARHGGNFFLALAFLLLIPYGFLAYGQAVTEMPQAAEALRALYPVAVIDEAPPAPAPAIVEPAIIEPAIEPAPAPVPPAPAPEPAPLPMVTEPGGPIIDEPLVRPLSIEPAPETATESAAPSEPAAAPDSAPAPLAAPPAPQDQPAADPDLTARPLAAPLNAEEAADKIRALERRVEQLTNDVELLKRGLSPIPAPPEAPVGLEAEGGLSAT